MTATESGVLGAAVPSRMAQGSVAWGGIIARIGVPFDDVAAMPVMLRYQDGEPVRASRGAFPVPLVYPYPPGAGEIREDAPDIPRLGAVSKAWVAPLGTGAAGLALHAIGTARGALAAELRTGRSVAVHADVSGVVELIIHAGYTVIAIDRWRLCKVVAHRLHHQGAVCRISQIPPGGAS